MRTSNARAHRAPRPSGGRSHNDLCAAKPKKYDYYWKSPSPRKGKRSKAEELNALWRSGELDFTRS